MVDPAPSRTIPFETDLATLAVFDPRVILHRMRQPSTWWREQSVLDVPEVLEGKIGLFPVGAEGVFSYRLTFDTASPLLEPEKTLSVGVVTGLGVQVAAEDLFVGAAERLPGDGIGDRIVALPGTGAFHKVPAGDYNVSVHVLDWRTNRNFYNEDGEPSPSAPPDFVVVLAKREKAFDAPMSLSALLDLVPRAEASAASLRLPPPMPRREPSPSRSPGSHRAPAPPVPEEPPPPPAFGVFELPLVRRAFRDVLDAERPKPPSPRWNGGTIVLKPRDSTLQTKDIPVDDLLTKITRLRDQMRLLEQKVNAHDTLEDEHKLVLDAHLSAVYESLTQISGLLAE